MDSSLGMRAAKASAAHVTCDPAARRPFTRRDHASPGNRLRLDREAPYIFSFHPRLTSHALTGQDVKKPAAIAICIMNQNTGDVFSSS